MRPLIDADILRYEVGYQGQFIDEDTNEVIRRSFDYVAACVDQKIEEICSLVWATEEPLIFLSMDLRTKKRHAKRLEKKIKRLERLRQKQDTGAVEGYELESEIASLKKQQVYKPNFRDGIAKRKEYKGNRKDSSKPLHYDGLTEYLLANYECVVAEGIEADDLISIYQTQALKENKDPTTIICSRDKDLKITPGLHFSWECGKQSQFGPKMVDELGFLRPIYDGYTAKGNPKMVDLKGTGMLFFGSQLITGDPTDNIPGLPNCGIAKAFSCLDGIKSVEEMYKIIASLYKEKFGENWREELLEQGRLLWMVRELDEEGKPVMWEIPKYLLEE